MTVRGQHSVDRQSLSRGTGTTGAQRDSFSGKCFSPPVRSALDAVGRLQLPVSGLERQRHPGRRADRYGDPRRVWIRGNTTTIRIATDRNHTNCALAEGGTILEIRRYLADFSNCCLGVVHGPNHDCLFSIADIQDFEMVDAFRGTRPRASRHWAVVVRPISCHVRGQNLTEKNDSGND